MYTTYVMSGDEHELLKNSSGNIVIPEGVTKIGPWVFKDYDDIISVTIPNSVTEIGKEAFYGCENLETVIMPANVKIGSCAFNGLPKLRKMILVHDDGTKTIERYIIREGDISPTENIIIPEGVTEIDENLFKGYRSLKSISIPDTVTTIGEGAFEDCTSLTSISIPDSVEYIGWRVFKGCTSLKSVKISNGMSEINNGAFEDCTSLTSISIPDSVVEIDTYAFKGCTSLKSVKIPKTMKYIREGAFIACTSLERIIIPKAASVGFNAVKGCNRLNMTKHLVKSFNTACKDCGEKINTYKDPCLEINWDGYMYQYLCSECGAQYHYSDYGNPCAFCDGYDCLSCKVRNDYDGFTPDIPDNVEWKNRR